MDEAHAGANGIGTALAEDTYVEVVGAEHFIQGFHTHTCHGMPLRGASGQLVGALCLSVRAPRVAQRLRELLGMAARGIQMEQAARQLQRRLQELRGDPSEAAQTLVSLHQEVVQAHASARLQLEVGAMRLRRNAGVELIAAAHESILRFARGARVWQLASGVPLHDPITTAELLRSATELMRTDAAIHGVELHTESLEDDAQSASAELAREVLTETERALRSVGEKGEVALSLRAQGVQLSVRSADGRSHRKALRAAFAA
jgi:transcriptional regulator of acetoin/glycerol metabolism